MNRKSAGKEKYTCLWLKDAASFVKMNLFKSHKSHRKG